MGRLASQQGEAEARYLREVEISTRIRSGQGDFVLFAITPPRQSTPAERLPEIARATVERLDHLDLDGLVLYDIDDERSRNPVERPFPFSPTVDPSEYRAEHLQAWRTPVIVYRAVGKYQREELGTWLTEQDPRRTLTVLVGAASSASIPAVSLADAQALRTELNPELLLGGVAIPERHSRRENEHLRLIAKQEAGCRFFVSQVVYDPNAAKNLVSDYRYECEARGLAPVPIVFTFSVCGSMKTLSSFAGSGSTSLGGSRTTSDTRPTRWRPHWSRPRQRPSSSSTSAVASGCPSASTWKASPSVVRRSRPRWTSPLGSRPTFGPRHATHHPAMAY